ncbi:hypothetical protein NDU88_005430, partial [Pleurodeles waltl]
MRSAVCNLSASFPQLTQCRGPSIRSADNKALQRRSPSWRIARGGPGRRATQGPCPGAGPCDASTDKLDSQRLRARGRDPTAGVLDSALGEGASSLVKTPPRLGSFPQGSH